VAEVVCRDKKVYLKVGNTLLEKHEHFPGFTVTQKDLEDLKKCE